MKDGAIRKKFTIYRLHLNEIKLIKLRIQLTKTKPCVTLIVSLEHMFVTF